jgi:hypothetical protein
MSRKRSSKQGGCDGLAELQAPRRRARSQLSEAIPKIALAAIYTRNIRSVYPWRPSSTRYGNFLTELAKANVTLDRDEYELPALLRSLVAAMRFVDCDPYAVSNELSRPLAILANAIRDVMAGGMPDLVFEQRHRKNHAPANMSIHAAHAAMAGAIDALIAAGVPRSEAALYVVRQAKHLRLRLARKGLTAEQALGWRDAMPGRAPKLAKEVYRDHVKKRNERFPLQRSEEARVEARRFAVGCLKGMRAAGF